MNQSEDQKNFEDSSIIVCVRARPLNEREISSSSSLALRFSQKNVVELFEEGVPSSPSCESPEKTARHHTFCYDSVFDSNVRQETLYQIAGHPVIHSSLKGFNNCIFAYGQTGSGKTYSMMGEEKDPGIIPRLCQELFVETDRLKEERLKEVEAALRRGDPSPPTLDIAIYVSYLEIYMERVRCLLNPSQTEVPKIRQHRTLGVYVENLKEIPVTSSEQILKLMAAGNSQRRTAKTGMNDLSSRSHAVFSIQLIQKNVHSSVEGEEAVSELRSKINLVDLAGSERAKSTGAEGKLLKEGSQINKSLSSLGLVIEALAKASSGGKRKQNAYIPYRDSTLTFLLKESLGGNSKTLMLATVSPATINYEETLSTLRYADRAKSIVIRAFINETAGEKRIRELEEEVQLLRKKIIAMESSQNAALPETVVSPRRDEMEEGENTNNVSLMRSELCRAEELIQQLTKTAKDREAEAQQAFEHVQNQTTLHVMRQEPFLVNVEGAGNWIMQYFVKDDLVITRDLPRDEGLTNQPTDIVEGEEKTWICIPTPLAEGIGSPHCCFHKSSNGDVMIYPSKDGITAVNDEPVDGERKLNSGDTITVGESLLQFIFRDPSAPLQTARRRLAPVMDVTAKEGSRPTRLATTPIVAKTVAVSRQTGDVVTSAPRLVGKIVPPIHVVDERKNNSSLLGPKALSGSGSFLPERRVRSSSLSVSTPHARLSTPRSSTPVLGGRRRAATPNSGRAATGGPSYRKSFETNSVRCRHHFILLGPPSSGKSYSIQNVLRPDKWYDFILTEDVQLEPTWGIARTSFSPSDDETIKLNFIELGGTSAFSVLMEQLPTYQVTFVICFPVHGYHFNEELKPCLDNILAHGSGEAVSIILFGTHVNGTESREALVAIFQKVEKTVQEYFDKCAARVAPVVSGMFGLDNMRRKVVSSGYSSMSKFSELLQWMMDHAVNRCKADKDYPSNLLSHRGSRLEAKLLISRSEQRWCLSQSAYSTLAYSVSDEYRVDNALLERETALLCDWGSLHMAEKDGDTMVVVDCRWIEQVLAIMSLFQPFIFTFDKKIETRELIAGTDGLLLLSAYALQRFGNYLPFNLLDVIAKDEYALLTHGAITRKVFQALLKRLMDKKNANTMDEALEYLERSDILIRGSKLYFPHAGLSPSTRRDSIGKSRIEGFYLVPTCFSYPPSTAIQQHLTRFLLGPCFQLKYNFLPPKYFSRLAARLSGVTDYVYPGPSNPCEVDGKSIAGNVLCPAWMCIPSTPRFWNKTVWLIGPGKERAFLYQRDNTIYLYCHGDSFTESSFHQNVLFTLLDKEKSRGLYSECSVLALPSTTFTANLGDLEPEESYYYPFDERNEMDDIIETMIHLIDGGDQDSIFDSDDIASDDSAPPTVFTRQPRLTTTLNTLVNDIAGCHQEENEMRYFVEAFCGWNDSQSASAENIKKDMMEGEALDKLVDSMSRLQ